MIINREKYSVKHMLTYTYRKQYIKITEGIDIFRKNNKILIKVKKKRTFSRTFHINFFFYKFFPWNKVLSLN